MAATEKGRVEVRIARYGSSCKRLIPHISDNEFLNLNGGGDRSSNAKGMNMEDVF